TVTCSSLRVRVRPTICGSDPKRLTQRPWLSNATFGPFPFTLFRCERPAELRLDAEQPKKIRRDGHATEAFGLALPGQFVVTNAIESKVGGEIGERLALRAQVEEVVDLSGAARHVACVFVIDDPHQPIGVLERQRADKE